MLSGVLDLTKLDSRISAPDCRQQELTRLALSPEDESVLAEDLQSRHHRDDGQSEHGHDAIAPHLLQLPAGAMHHTCHAHTIH